MNWEYSVLWGPKVTWSLAWSRSEGIFVWPLVSLSKKTSHIYSSILLFRWVKSNDSQRLCRCWWFTEERKQAHRWPPTVDRRGPTPWGSLFCEEVYEYLCSKVANYSCSYIKRWICDPQQHRIYMMEGLTLLVSCVFIGSPLLVKLKIECGHFYTCGRAPLNIFIP